MRGRRLHMHTTRREEQLGTNTDTHTLRIAKEKGRIPASGVWAWVCASGWRVWRLIVDC